MNELFVIYWVLLIPFDLNKMFRHLTTNALF